MTNNDVNTKNESAYASLTGFRRAIPIILVALALFTGLCFITKDTGALGNIISNVLLGLFSVGGYVIPFLLVIHAIFYPSDYREKRTVSRVIFSLVVVIFVSVTTHVIINWENGDLVFTPAEFYTNGILLQSGGFIGGVVAFALEYVLGMVGLIIIAIAIFALYVTYFFTGGKRTFARLFGKIGQWFSSLFNSLAEKKKERERIKEEKKNERTARMLAVTQDPLMDDEFFEADNGMSEISIRELGIREVKDPVKSEKDPHLSESVDHKSQLSESEPGSKQRRADIEFDYGVDDEPVNNFGTAPDEPSYTFEEPRYSSPTTEQSADSFFGGGFESFGFKMDEALMNKPSSKTPRQSTVMPEEKRGINEIVTEISEEEIEKARIRADLEMKKRAAIEAQQRYERARQEANFRSPAEEPTVTPTPSATPTYTATTAVPSYTQPEPTVTPTPSAAPTYAATTAEPTYTQPEPTVTPTPSTVPTYAATTAEPTYTQPEPTVTPTPSAAPTYTATEQKDDRLGIAQERFRLAAERANIINGYANERREEKNDNVNTATAKPEPTPEVTHEPAIITTERSMLSPTPTDENMTNEPIDEPSETMLDFEFDTDSVEPETPEAQQTESPLGYEEIPPEEQNETVLAYQNMFPFLSQNETESSTDEDEEEDDDDFITVEPDEEYSDTEEDDEDEDEPPFEAPTEKKSEPPAQPAKPSYKDYKLPPTDLLLIKQNTGTDESQNDEINENADNLVNTLMQFNVRVTVKGVDRGPRITRYEIVPAMGVRVNSVMSLYNDIVLNLGIEGVRMEAPIPGKKAIGVEIPNKNPSTVYLRELVETEKFQNSASKTLACLGQDVTGVPVFEDIAKMPHLLVAGATGMGKSVCINAILISILYKATPDDVRFIMIDPKKVEFKRYNGIPHLLVPVVTDVKQAAGALMWAVEQMEKRYDLMEKLAVSKLDAYNEIVREHPELGEPLPKIIIVIDELNDIMIQVRKPAEDLIMSIAQKARAAGIHLIIGTQRPSVNVITGTIKANIPSRISCKVASFTDSKTILEQAGAEKLLNNGDMLYITAGTPKPIRVQGAFVSDNEVSAVMKYLKSQAKGEVYDEQALEEINRAAQKCSKGGKGDDDYDDEDGGDDGILNDQQFLDAVDVALRSGKISTSLLQRKLKIGFGKAARFIDAMEELGLVSEPNAQKAREVLVSRDEWHEMLARRSLDD